MSVRAGLLWEPSLLLVAEATLPSSMLLSFVELVVVADSLWRRCRANPTEPKRSTIVQTLTIIIARRDVCCIPSGCEVR